MLRVKSVRLCCRQGLERPQAESLCSNTSRCRDDVPGSEWVAGHVLAVIGSEGRARALSSDVKMTTRQADYDMGGSPGTSLAQLVRRSFGLPLMGITCPVTGRF